MLAGRRGGLGQLAGGPGEPRRRRWLDEAVPDDVGPPRGQVLVDGGLAQREHGLRARLGSREGCRPLVAGSFGKTVPEKLTQRGPVAGVGPVRRAGQAEPGEQRGVEPRLERAHRHPLAVRGLVHVVPGHAAVEQVDPALVPPHPLVQEHQRHGEQRRHPVHDRGVHHLALPGACPLDQRRADAERHQHPPAAEVPQQVGGELRRAARPAEGVQRAGPGDVADVVPHRLRQRAVLPPAGHPGVDQPRVAGQADVGPDAQALGHPRPQALEQHVRAVGQPQQRVHRARVLQVEHGRPAAAVHQLKLGSGRSGAWPVDPQHAGAQVGEQHGAERPGPDARELQHPHPGQRPGSVL